MEKLQVAYRHQQFIIMKKKNKMGLSVIEKMMTGIGLSYISKILYK